MGPGLGGVNFTSAPSCEESSAGSIPPNWSRLRGIFPHRWLRPGLPLPDGPNSPGWKCSLARRPDDGLAAGGNFGWLTAESCVQFSPAALLADWPHFAASRLSFLRPRPVSDPAILQTWIRARNRPKTRRPARCPCYCSSGRTTALGSMDVKRSALLKCHSRLPGRQLLKPVLTEPGQL